MYVSLTLYVLFLTLCGIFNSLCVHLLTLCASLNSVCIFYLFVWLLPRMFNKKEDALAAAAEIMQLWRGCMISADAGARHEYVASPREASVVSLGLESSFLWEACCLSLGRDGQDLSFL